MLSKQLLYGVAWITSAACWNVDVHQQIGFGGELFLSPQTSSILAEILEPKYNGSIGRAAAWADEYGNTSEGRYSKKWHYIDTNDWAPDRCNLTYPADCAKDGCVVSAIANQTGILRECIQQVTTGALRGGSNLTCSYALKWVTHFIGDVNQPLHSSGRAIGGNTFPVKFDNKPSQMHKLWDQLLPYFAAKIVGPFSSESIDPFTVGLVERIRKDQFFEAPYMWLECSDPSTPEVCAYRWAKEGNKWDCDYVYSRVRNGSDLALDGYAVGAVPIVELQISKAILRLGTWLEKLVSSVHHVQETQEFLEL